MKQKSSDKKRPRQEHPQEPHDNVKQSLAKNETPLERLSRKASNHTPKVTSILPRTRQEQQEDAYISYLESKLGWSKSGSKTSKYGKGMEEDGLDGASGMFGSCFIQLTQIRITKTCWLTLTRSRHPFSQKCVAL